MKLSAIERFWRHVDKDGPVPEARPDLGPCWVWTGHVREDDGYAKFRLGGREDGDEYVHRFAYATFVGPIPAGHEVDHLCLNRRCVNYERHLEPVTEEENARRRRKALCAKSLHPMTGENLIEGRFRRCRACKRDKDRRAYARKVAA